MLRGSLALGLGMGLIGCAEGPRATTSDASASDTTAVAEETGASASESGSTGSTTTAPASDSSSEGDDDAADDSGLLFDVGGLPDVPTSACMGPGGGGGGVELSYIWIANSQQVTISKIDTDTMEEHGRYSTKPASGDPSRTSVNLNGDVAVANRNGGVAKFWANEADCAESNGQPGIQTSTGGADILTWEDEECRAWYTPLVCSSNRPVAWTRGEWSEATCRYENPKLWTVCDGNVLLLDGETGDTVETIALGGNAFVYGGAADADGNFWALELGSSQLARVDHEDYSLLTFGLPNSGAYGITVDKEGRPWVCSSTVARFNLDTSTWSVSNDQSGGGGCMTDGETTIWHGSGTGMMGFDTESLELIQTIPLPNYVHGISVDFAGKVWGVTVGAQAYRADPESLEVLTFNGLVGAYTYSDMTGFQLSSAGGGGIPQG